MSISTGFRFRHLQVDSSTSSLNQGWQLYADDIIALVIHNLPLDNQAQLKDNLTSFILCHVRP